MRSIAFVIVAWNAERTIGECLASVLGIQGYDLRVYVVDNGSHDDTAAIVEGLQDARVRLLRLPRNCGISVGRNVGLNEIPADIEFVSMLDSDAYINQTAIDELVNTLTTHPTIGIVGAELIDRQGIDCQAGRNLPTIGIKIRKVAPLSSVHKQGVAMEQPKTPIIDSLQEVDYVVGAFWLMRRCLVDKVGVFDERFFFGPDDVDYCVRAWLAGYQVVVDHKAHAIHDYQGRTKRFFTRQNARHLRDLIRYFRKYGVL